MRIADIVSALEELGTIYRHASKNEPKHCIAQVLALLKGKEQLLLSDLKGLPNGKPQKPPKPAKPPKQFDQEKHLTSLLDAQTEPVFAAAIENSQESETHKR